MLSHKVYGFSFTFGNFLYFGLSLVMTLLNATGPVVYITSKCFSIAENKGLFFISSIISKNTGFPGLAAMNALVIIVEKLELAKRYNSSSSSNNSSNGPNN